MVAHRPEDDTQSELELCTGEQQAARGVRLQTRMGATDENTAAVPDVGHSPGGLEVPGPAWFAAALRVWLPSAKTDEIDHDEGVHDEQRDTPGTEPTRQLHELERQERDRRADD